MERAAIVAAATLLACASTSLDAQTLRGSPQAMQKQNRIAVQHDYTFLRTAGQVAQFVSAGYLVHMPGNGDYELASVSYPYARPAVKLFVERLASQYRSACGEKLVVTSLTRPISEQPRNASALSVHPAGMAVDLRVSGRAACRNWLERTLMSLERQGVLDAIRENRPPHYHVALFPNQYARYVARIDAPAAARLASASAGAGRGTVATANPGPARGSSATSTGTAGAAADSRPTISTANVAPDRSATTSARTSADAVAASLAAEPEAVAEYRVNRGDSLWSIARRHNTTVDMLQSLNGLRNTRIVAGQKLTVPSTVATGADS